MMQLTTEEQAILSGSKGPALQKAMRSVVAFGETFGATGLVRITGPGHLVTSFGASMIGPHYRMMEELIGAGLHTPWPFTVDPRPADFKNVPSSLPEKLVTRLVYSRQRPYEAQLARVGLRNADAFTCTCYLPEVGNRPKFGDVLAWSESSAVVFANSVIGARTNRNSGGIDLLCNLLGKAPLFGLLTDEGRRADWLVEVRTTSLPNAQVLGSAIGMRVMEDVPYIVGLDQWLGSGVSDAAADYLKDMGAASASNGAVGLYHVEGMTPEAVKIGRGLLRREYRTYVVDDAELERVAASYPVLWREPGARPSLCFVGCPHLSLGQLHQWTEAIVQAVRQYGRPRLAVPTVLCAAPDVLRAFRASGSAEARLLATGARLTSLCPLMFMNNPLSARRPVVTNSNKLRTYSTARFYPDEELLAIISSGRLQEEG